MNASTEKQLVSIVVPVYNVEAYVEKCLLSILHQTYKNIEVIVVNDGSPDHSEDIILRLADSDPRIKYLKKENGGLSSARNAGIDIATGDYICFVDSDDWLDKNFVQVMTNAIIQDESDIAICNMTYIYSDGHIKKRTPVIEAHEIVKNIDALRDLFNGVKFKFHAQNKIYRAELFKNTEIRYPIAKIYEDVFTTYRLFYLAKRISYVNENLYFYLQNRPGSILQTRFNKNRFDVYEALDKIKVFVAEKELPINDELQHLVVINTISLGNYIYPIYDSLDKDEYEECHRIFENVILKYNMTGWQKNSCIRWIEKLRFGLLISDFGGYLRLMRLIKRG